MIEINGVEKRYRSGLGLLPGRDVMALGGITLAARRGEALGLIGVNGAGKSTLLRVILGYVRPTAGDALVGGMRPRAYAERNGVAYLPEHVRVPGGWTVRRALTAYAMLADLGADAHQRVERSMERLGLAALADRRVGRLSKGNVQRLGIAQAVLGERELMVLDEPTDGLDPIWIAELRAIIAEWRAADPARTLIIASHNLGEVEKITDRVLVLHEGAVREEIQMEPGMSGRLEERFLELVRGWGGGA
jgi:ABC-type multidrug transport system ATPase subunit